MSIAMNIIITKPKYNKYETFNFICNDLEECKNKIIVTVKNIIFATIDYPLDITEFELLWYSDNYMDNRVFDYNIFQNNEWIKPWSDQELYESILELIYTIDVQDSLFNESNFINK
jgi:hypothetical protein